MILYLHEFLLVSFGGSLMALKLRPLVRIFGAFDWTKGGYFKPFFIKIKLSKFVYQDGFRKRLFAQQIVFRKRLRHD